MNVILMLITILAALLLVWVLIKYLSAIVKVLNTIGGAPASYLAKLRLGLRAIEQETGHLAPQVTQLNETLQKTSEGLKVVDERLSGTIEAVLKQGKK